MKYRSIDGTGNNLKNPNENAVGTDFSRIGPANFADGYYSMVTTEPNARDISNIVVADPGNTVQPEGLSGMMYAWGQFIDHDLDKMASQTSAGSDITVTTSNDPVFGNNGIQVNRVVIDPKTGEGTGKPAAAVNNITGWLDASMVYGSDAATAAKLRLSDGHMATSNGGKNLPVDASGMFMAGDARAAENPDLTALQTLFVREHNYQVDKLKAAHPDWTGDHLYEQAKAIVTAEIAHITYTEFLPHLLGPDLLTKYKGYNPKVDASISAEFAGAAYRFGHSIVSAELNSISENGTEQSAQALKDAFFEPASTFASTGSGADGLLRHLAGDSSNALDVHIVDDLRNFLFSPGQGQDLAAINIQRGRDLGLGTLNQTREALGLKKYTSFLELTGGDAVTANALQSAYGSIDSVDLWTGGLAEKHMPGAMIGETFGIIIAHQFENLRDGDRYWYENQGFDNKTLDSIENTTLSDLIKRDTDTQYMQSDAFVFYNRHSGVKGGVTASSADDNQLVIGANDGDTLYGGHKDDMLYAGAGNDLMEAYTGKNSYDGGGGVNTVDYSWTSHGVRVDLRCGTGSSIGGGAEAFTDTLKNVQNLIGGAGDDVMYGDRNDNTFTYTGGTDKYYGGGGKDTADFSRSSNAIYVNLQEGGTVYTAGTGDATNKKLDKTKEATLSSIENVVGTNGNDYMVGDWCANVFTGGRGDDVFTGGGGKDTYVFAAGSGKDRITDFRATGVQHDLLDFSAMALNTGSNTAAYILAHTTYSHGNSIVSFDGDFDGSTANNSVTLQGVDLHKLSAKQLVADFKFA